MFISTLPAVRSRLASHQPLREFIEANYPGYTPTFLVGLKPDEANATAMPVDLFPYVTVYPLTDTKPAGKDVERADRIGIMFGLHDDRIDADGMARGVMNLAHVGELILKALEEQPIGNAPAVVWDGAADMRMDAGITAPWYEGEILISLSVRK